MSGCGGLWIIPRGQNVAAQVAEKLKTEKKFNTSTSQSHTEIQLTKPAVEVLRLIWFQTPQTGSGK